MQLVRKLVEFHPYGPALKGSGDERAKATKLLNEIQESCCGVRLDGWMVGWLDGWMVVVTRCFRRFEGLLVVASFAWIFPPATSQLVSAALLRESSLAPSTCLLLRLPSP